MNPKKFKFGVFSKVLFILLFVCVVLPYFFFGVYSLSYNIALWPETARQAYCILSGITFGIGMCILLFALLEDSV